MTTISGVSPNSYGYNAPATSTGGSVSKKPNAGVAQSTSLSSVENTLASLGGSSSSPLTYNATGLLNSLQQATSAKATTATTSVQAAQQAVLAAENVVTETLNSLTSGSSSNSSTSDNSALFGLPGASGTSDPFGLAQGSLSKPATNTSPAGSSGAQAAYDAVLAAENVVTETLNSLASGSSSNSPNSKI